MATRRVARANARPKKTRKKRRQPARSAVILRWCIVGVAVLMAFLYYRPLASYVETRSALNERAAEVGELRAERARLARRLEASTTTTALAREARQLNLVRPGERLFIVKGVKEWRRAHAKRVRTIEDDG